MRDHLSVGFGREDMAVSFQFLAQFAEVLDDAIVDDGDFLRGMRVRIVLARPPMRRPARMSDADRAAQWRLLQQPLEVCDFANRATTYDLAAIERRHAG